MNIGNVQEVEEGILSEQQLGEKLDQGTAVVFKGTDHPVAVGHGLLIKVNTNIGVSDRASLDAEIAKLKKLAALGFRPDTMMDHTIVHFDKPFWKYMLEEFDGPVGTLPHYLSFKPGQGIDSIEFMERLEEMAEAGVSFMTLHPTPNRYLYQIAKETRFTPTSSRGGGVVLRDMILNNRPENVISQNFDRIMQIFRKHNIVISIGSTFRSANVVEALDKAHREETRIQGEYIRRAKKAGVQVMMEGIGHITLDKLPQYADLIKEYGVPFMPLGPIPTDAAIGFDHVTSAIGASFLSMLGVAHIINSITREEHTGGVPSSESVVEGLKAARIAAHCVNIAKFWEVARVDRAIAENRSRNRSCFGEGGFFTGTSKMIATLGCNRCRAECPLLVGLSE